jgi:predicted acetyltransferase
MRFSADERERFIAAIEPERALVAVVDGEVAGTLKSHLVPLTLPGLVLSDVAVVSEAAVLPTQRRKGLFSAIMGRFLLDEQARKEPVVLLAASEGAIYGRYGFGPAVWSARYSIAHSRAALRDGLDAAGSVRFLSPGEVRSCAPPIFDAARRAGTGEVARLDGWWEDLFAGLDLERGADRDYAACYEENGSVDGYVIYRIVPGLLARRERELVVVELVSTTPNAYAGLWRFVLGIDLMATVLTEERPVDEPLRHLLADPRALETVEVVDRSWVRLVDAAAALELRRYGFEGELVLEIEDELCPWNAGRVALEVHRGVANVFPTSTPAVLRLDAAALGAIYLGGTSVVTLAAAARVTELEHGAARVADAFFLTSPPPFCASGL